MWIILELNAKGVILQAFEEYRLRSCVDFKPYEGETSYISFSKLSGWAAACRSASAVTSAVAQLYVPRCWLIKLKALRTKD